MALRERHKSGEEFECTRECGTSCDAHKWKLCMHAELLDEIVYQPRRIHRDTHHSLSNHARYDRCRSASATYKLELQKAAFRRLDGKTDR